MTIHQPFPSFWGVFCNPPPEEIWPLLEPIPEVWVIGCKLRPKAVSIIRLPFLKGPTAYTGLRLEVAYYEMGYQKVIGLLKQGISPEAYYTKYRATPGVGMKILQEYLALV